MLSSSVLFERSEFLIAPPDHDSRFLRWHASRHSEGDPKTSAGTQNKWKNRQRSSFTQLGVWPPENVCHAPHSHPSTNINYVVSLVSVSAATRFNRFSIWYIHRSMYLDTYQVCTYDDLTFLFFVWGIRFVSVRAHLIGLQKICFQKSKIKIKNR